MREDLGFLLVSHDRCMGGRGYNSWTYGTLKECMSMLDELAKECYTIDSVEWKDAHPTLLTLNLRVRHLPSTGNWDFHFGYELYLGGERVSLDLPKLLKEKVPTGDGGWLYYSRLSLEIFRGGDPDIWAQQLRSLSGWESQFQSESTGISYEAEELRGKWLTLLDLGL